MAELETDESVKVSVVDALPEVKSEVKPNLNEVKPEEKSDSSDSSDSTDLSQFVVMDTIPVTDVKKMREFLDVLKDCFQPMNHLSLNQFIKWVIDYDARCFALTLYDQIIAATTVRVTHENDKAAKYLQHFCVMSPFRNMGLGKIFLNKVADEEEFLYWTTNMEALPFFLKSGARIHEEGKDNIWCTIYSKEIRELLNEEELINKVLLEQYKK